MRHGISPAAAAVNPVNPVATAVEATKTPRKCDRATHRGTCQVCGRLQKLPAGKLSKHGYTKRWGFFEGTCPGAHYRPFEQAFDRIQVAIDRTKGQIADLQDQQAQLRGPIDSNLAPYHKYDPYLGGYYESTVIVDLANGAIRLTEKSSDPSKPGKVHWGNQYGCFGTVEQAIRKLRDQRNDRIVRDIQRRNEYVQWQEKRIAEWKPGELQPVKG
jgi:hypothetical protein